MDYTKNSDIRANNRKRVINTLFREGAMTKQDLASKLEMSLPTVTLLLNEFIEKGYVTKGEALDSTGGRKPILMEPVYNVKYAVGMEVSGHDVRLAAIDLGGNILAKESHHYELENSAAYWEKINVLLMDFISREIEDPEKLLEVGLTLQIPMKDRAPVWSKHTPKEERLDFSIVRSCIQRPIRFQHSVRMAAVAQVWALNTREDFVYVSFGSSVNGAIIYEGNLLALSSVNGEFGNLRIHTEDGMKRMSEICSSKSLCSRSGAENVKQFFERLEQGDKKCGQIWEDHIETIVQFLHNIHNIFGWKIVIGGSLSPYLEPYCQEIEKRLGELYDFEDGYKPYIQLSSLGEYGAAVGAAMLPMDQYLEFGRYDP